MKTFESVPRAAGAAARTAIVVGAETVLGREICADLQAHDWQVTATPPCTGRFASGAELDEVAAGVSDETAGPQLLVVVPTVLPPQLPNDLLDGDRWSDVVEAILRPAVSACRAALPLMARNNESSIVLIVPSENNTDVLTATAAGALVGMLRTLAVEAAEHGVRVCGVTAHTSGEIQDLSSLLDSVRFLVEEGTYFTGQVLTPTRRSR